MMQLPAYYNEIDSYCCDWLSNLMDVGLITPGYIDNRSIVDVRPSDLAGYIRCHFFAGIGVWDYALNRAEWGARPAWTGSCPCQPFSAAGQGNGFDDERHLWPYLHHLIRVCRPAKFFGEQVASKDGLNWLDLVQSDLEGEEYAFGAQDRCSAGVGAPHIRQRLYIVAEDLLEYATSHGRQQRRTQSSQRSAFSGRGFDFVGDTIGTRLEGHRGDVADRGRSGWFREIEGRPVAETIAIGELAYPASEQRDTGRVGTTSEQSEEIVRSTRHGSIASRAKEQGSSPVVERIGRPGPTNGHWRNADWLFCRDGKWRPVEPGTFPLVNGAPARVGRLRAYGNAIDAENATDWIATCLEEERDRTRVQARARHLADII